MKKLIVILMMLMGCVYKPVPTSEQEGSECQCGIPAFMTCFHREKIYFQGSIVITGTISEALLPFLDGNWTLSKLNSDEDFCSVSVPEFLEDE